LSAALALAFGAGLLATVNPCGFALLPSFLGLYVGAAEGADQREPLLGRAAQGFLVGVALSAGFGAVFVIAGLVVAVGLHAFVDLVPWLAVAIGAALIGRCDHLRGGGAGRGSSAPLFGIQESARADS
jgi:cytochrome c biogenesis protein CcdA